VEQAVGVDDEAAGLQGNAGQESVHREGRGTNREADLPEPVEDAACGRIKLLSLESEEGWKELEWSESL